MDRSKTHFWNQIDPNWTQISKFLGFFLQNLDPKQLIFWNLEIIFFSQNGLWKAVKWPTYRPKPVFIASKAAQSLFLEISWLLAVFGHFEFFWRKNGAKFSQKLSQKWKLADQNAQKASTSTFPKIITAAISKFFGLQKISLFVAQLRGFKAFSKISWNPKSSNFFQYHPKSGNFGQF